ncbi:MAG TPA: FHA domain-containing protein [Dehalococcoidia bacterium]|jgi:hypothetical protein
MTRAALVWSDNEHLRMATLAEDVANLIGRADDATVHLTARTVSRRQATVVCMGGAFAIQHVGTTNPTFVDGAALEPQRAPTALRDGAEIDVPDLRLTFHDLAAADRVEYHTRCGYCSRSLRPADLVCWYCGTSLDSASSVYAVQRSVACRLVAQGGAVFDLCSGESLAFRGDGAVDVWRQGSRPNMPAVVAREDGVWLMLPPDVATPAGSCRRLRSGIELHTGAGSFIVIVR